MVLTLLAAALAFQGGKLEKKDVVVGRGPAAKFADVVTVDYTGKLLSGKQFDSSAGRAPFTFVLGAGMVIKGWEQGVAGMKVGGKRKLKIPAGLAYGSRQMGPDIPPNSTLLFDVELKKIQRVGLKVLKKGSGAAAKGGDEVAIEYVGTLKSNGTQFDASNGKPIRFQLGGGVIPGFTAGVLGMKLGEKRRITIPSELGYGERAVGPIPANSDLVFQIELVGLNGASK